MGQFNYDNNLDSGSIWQAIGSIFLTIIGMVTLNDAVLIMAIIASGTTVIINIKKLFTNDKNSRNTGDR